MKIYLSADIEGVTGVTHWHETEMQKPDSGEFREQMTAEVAAACEGALQAGATEILVKDAHDTARNILAAKLPPQVRLARGWSGHPLTLMQEIDETFAGVIFIGYHSRAGGPTSPLSHTLTGSAMYIKLNDQYASEFLINTYAAALFNVPVVFISGDQGVCDEAAALNPRMGTAAVKTGIGNSTVSIHPKVAVTRIQEGVAAALKNDLASCRVALPSRFSVDIQYKNHFDAYKASFFPGVSLTAPTTVHFEAQNYFEVLRMFLFTTWF
jgi:D-amino peptidase